MSNSYPVKVMPDLSLKSITVDGKNIEGFNKEVKSYSYLLKTGSKIPVVKALQWSVMLGRYCTSKRSAWNGCY